MRIIKSRIDVLAGVSALAYPASVLLLRKKEDAFTINLVNFVISLVDVLGTVKSLAATRNNKSRHVTRTSPPGTRSRSGLKKRRRLSPPIGFTPMRKKQKVHDGVENNVNSVSTNCIPPEIFWRALFNINNSHQSTPVSSSRVLATPTTPSRSSIPRQAKSAQMLAYESSSEPSVPSHEPSLSAMSEEDEAASVDLDSSDLAKRDWADLRAQDQPTRSDEEFIESDERLEDDEADYEPEEGPTSSSFGSSLRSSSLGQVSLTTLKHEVLAENNLLN